MEIERINENTVKFFISYIDIEDRGFEREEIWYNRERSEQLFWQMMDEVNYEEDFNVDGPLWIQVQAMEKGLEIIVTKAQVSKNGEHLELPGENGKTIDLSPDEKIDDLLENKFGEDEEVDEEDVDDQMSLVMKFHDFEDVIQLSHYMPISLNGMENRLYYYADHYFLYIAFEEEMMDDDRQENIISMVFEFSEDTQTTIHLLEEYGKPIFSDDTFEQIRTHFPSQV